MRLPCAEQKVLKAQTSQGGGGPVNGEWQRGPSKAVVKRVNGELPSTAFSLAANVVPSSVYLTERAEKSSQGKSR